MVFTGMVRKDAVVISRSQNKMARREGLEPPTDRFEVCDSIH